jgi:hypothetical protein
MIHPLMQRIITTSFLLATTLLAAQEVTLPKYTVVKGDLPRQAAEQ